MQSPPSRSPGNSMSPVSRGSVGRSPIAAAGSTSSPPASAPPLARLVGPEMSSRIDETVEGLVRKALKARLDRGGKADRGVQGKQGSARDGPSSVSQASRVQAVRLGLTAALRKVAKRERAAAASELSKQMAAERRLIESRQRRMYRRIQRLHRMRGTIPASSPSPAVAEQLARDTLAGAGISVMPADRLRPNTSPLAECGTGNARSPITAGGSAQAQRSRQEELRGTQRLRQEELHGTQEELHGTGSPPAVDDGCDGHTVMTALSFSSGIDPEEAVGARGGAGHGASEPSPTAAGAACDESSPSSQAQLVPSRSTGTAAMEPGDSTVNPGPSSHIPVRTDRTSPTAAAAKGAGTAHRPQQPDSSHQSKGKPSSGTGSR